MLLLVDVKSDAVLHHQVHLGIEVEDRGRSARQLLPTWDCGQMAIGAA